MISRGDKRASIESTVANVEFLKGALEVAKKKYTLERAQIADIHK